LADRAVEIDGGERRAEVVDLERVRHGKRRLAVGALPRRQRPERLFELWAVEEAVVDVRLLLRAFLERAAEEGAATGVELLRASGFEDRWRWLTR
jgi:hypothetical protein